MFNFIELNEVIIPKNDMEYGIFYMSYYNIYDSFGIQIKLNYLLEYLLMK